jgi:hypothetical protein
MATNTPMIISKNAQAGILAFSKQCYNMLNQQWNVREQMRKIDLAYMREVDLTATQSKSKLANNYGDANKFRNITMPVILPAVEAAVTYQSSVFLTGEPIIGVVAHPDFEDAAMSMEALMEDHSTRGGWKRHLQMVFRDGFKYNIGCAEVSWQEETTVVLDTDSQFAGGKQGKPREVVWAGNKIIHRDMYNTFWDTRVSVTDVPMWAEYAGFTELKSRVALKQYIATLPDKMVDNIVAAFESGLGGTSTGATGSGSYYIPPINSEALTNVNIRSGTDWMAWAQVSNSSSTIAYKNIYELTTLYARIIPSDFGMRVPSPNTPQVWKFVYVNHQVLIYAERQTNAHGLIPLFFIQPLEDGLSYQTKSLANNVEPIQAVTTAMMNSVMAARRRAVSDRGLYDPSRVSENNINSDNPSAKIPVRPAAYGKPLGEAYFPIPFEDRQSATIMSEMGVILKLSDVITGQNPSRQGQFVKGNKTQTEYSDVMNNSNGRDQGTSLLIEDQFFTPVKMVLKTNILQYQGAGSLFYKNKKVTVQIDPVKLRKAVIEFKMTDGLTPASKLINSDSFATALQVFGSSPQIAASYNIGPMFSYMMKTQGAHLDDFEKSKEQVAYEQAINQWMQMAQLALSKGQEWKIPQPAPQQFNYLVPGAQEQEEPDPLQSFISTIAANAAPAQAPDIGAVTPGTQ